MPKDTVLRALVVGTIDGKKGSWIIDAFERDDCYALVKQWATDIHEKGDYPTQYLGIPKKFFEIISDPNSPYELKCLRGIDFDKLLPRDRTEIDAASIDSDDLFYPRPED